MNWKVQFGLRNLGAKISLMSALAATSLCAILTSSAFEL